MRYHESVPSRDLEQKEKPRRSRSAGGACASSVNSDDDSDEKAHGFTEETDKRESGGEYCPLPSGMGVGGVTMSCAMVVPARIGCEVSVPIAGYQTREESRAA